jgi:DNA-directed RNA polymerase subunit K/omega
MTDLFLDPKVLNYQKDKYELIILTLRWARAMKSKGSPETMPVLVEKALRDIVDNKITKEEILANKIIEPAPTEELPSVVSVADEGPDGLKVAQLPPDDEDDEEAKKKKKKKKDGE